MPTFCRHNRFLERCLICSREADEAAGRLPAPRGSRTATSTPRRAGATSRVRSGGAALSVRRELRAEDDGYRAELVPGLRASADAERLAQEIAFSSGRLLVLATEPPGTYAQAHALAGTDRERATWICFVTAYVCPLEDDAPFAAIERVLAESDPDLDGVPLGPRTSHDPARGSRTLEAFRQWLARAVGPPGALAGESSWTPERRFERLYERLALPGLARAARYDLLVTAGRLGLSDVDAGSLNLVQAGGETTADATLSAAKRVFGIGEPLLLERRAAALADAAVVPIAALDLALSNWGAQQRASMGVAPGTHDETALEGARAALGL